MASPRSSTGSPGSPPEFGYLSPPSANRIGDRPEKKKAILALNPEQGRVSTPQKPCSEDPIWGSELEETVLETSPSVPDEPELARRAKLSNLNLSRVSQMAFFFLKESPPKSLTVFCYY